MEQVGKVKVALICHFSNKQIRDMLDLHIGSHNKYRDFGLWNVNIIEGLRKRDDIELHVIAPHNGMKKNVQVFELGEVFYHFYRAYLPFPFGGILKRIGWYELTNYRGNRKVIKSLVDKIKPDIVNLVGAENPYYSTSVLDIEHIPVVLHCQTVYANPDRVKNTGSVNKYRWNIEKRLFHKIPYMACTGRMYYDLLKGYEPDAIIFPRKWPESKYPIIPDVPKKYDFAYFARMLNKNKGFDNAIEAIAIAVRKHPELKVLAVGSWDSDREFFEKRIEELGIKENLEIHPPFPDYLEMLQYVKQSRFALLPIKMDVVSGTIFEAMNMGMPVVTCRTSGTPSLNEKRETVLISDIGDNEALAENMMKLYENKDYAETLKQSGLLYIKEWEDENSHNVDEMVEQYKAVIAHYHDGTPIPQELLYNTEENIDYRE